MPTIGIDCDITLIHPQVNGGNPVGFLLAMPEKQPFKPFGPAVTIQYETLQTALGEPRNVYHAYIKIIIADGLQNPDGSIHQHTAAQMRSCLLEIISKHTDITLVTRYGSYGNLKTLSETIHTLIGYQVFPMLDYAQFKNLELFTVHLTTIAGSFAPVDHSVFVDSLWVDEGTYTGALTWDNSYWR